MNPLIGEPALPTSPSELIGRLTLLQCLRKPATSWLPQLCAEGVPPTQLALAFRSMGESVFDILAGLHEAHRQHTLTVSAARAACRALGIHPLSLALQAFAVDEGREASTLLRGLRFPPEMAHLFPDFNGTPGAPWPRRLLVPGKVEFSHIQLPPGAMKGWAIQGALHLTEVTLPPALPRDLWVGRVLHIQNATGLTSLRSLALITPDGAARMARKLAQPVVPLASFVLSECPDLTSLPTRLQGVVITLHQLPRLTTLPRRLECAWLSLSDLPTPPTLGKGWRSDDLQLHRLPELVRWIPDEDAPSHTLRVTDCPRLRTLGPLPSQSTLILRGCPALRTLRQPHLLDNLSLADLDGLRELEVPRPGRLEVVRCWELRHGPWLDPADTAPAILQACPRLEAPLRPAPSLPKGGGLSHQGCVPGPDEAALGRAFGWHGYLREAKARRNLRTSLRRGESPISTLDAYVAQVDTPFALARGLGEVLRASALDQVSALRWLEDRGLHPLVVILTGWSEAERLDFARRLGLEDSLLPPEDDLSAVHFYAPPHSQLRDMRWFPAGLAMAFSGDLAPGLHVELGVVVMDYQSPTTLPEDLTVGGDLTFNNVSRFAPLPSSLRVGGNLRFEGCAHPPDLPSAAEIGGMLIIK